MPFPGQGSWVRRHRGLQVDDADLPAAPARTRREHRPRRRCNRRAGRWDQPHVRPTRHSPAPSARRARISRRGKGAGRIWSMPRPVMTSPHRNSVTRRSASRGISCGRETGSGTACSPPGRAPATPAINAPPATTRKRRRDKSSEHRGDFVDVLSRCSCHTRHASRWDRRAAARILRKLVLDHTFIGGDLEQRIRLAATDGPSVLVALDLGDLEELFGHVAAEVNHSTNPSIARHLLRAVVGLRSGV